MSGKSTLLKTAQLGFDGTYSRTARESFKDIIFSNTVQTMRVILEAMESFELSFDDTRINYHAQTIFMQPPIMETDYLDLEICQAIEALWKDHGVIEAFERSREYQLNDSAA